MMRLREFFARIARSGASMKRGTFWRNETNAGKVNQSSALSLRARNHGASSIGLRPPFRSRFNEAAAKSAAEDD
jgi:hypothetical protein